MGSGDALKTIEWCSTLELGNPTIDKQHKSLLDLINRVIEAVDNEAGQTRLNGVFIQLFTYASQHRKEHLNFIGYVDELNRKVTHKLTTKRADVEMARFLMNWFRDHILVKDKAFISFMEEN